MDSHTHRSVGMRRLLRQATDAVLDVLLPHQCLGCGAIVETAGVLCPTCWGDLTFIGPPHCHACGLPFEFDPGPGALCAACSREAPLIERTRAALAYSDASRTLILGFKHGDHTEAAAALAKWMLRAGADLVEEADLIVPVPLHWTRLFSRRYNQAALLAKEMSRETGIACVPDALLRRRRTPSQGRLGRAGRRRNVRGAFAVAERNREKLADRRVLLVDDVLTTGATLTACARTLLRGGARAVDAVTLARVVDSGL